MEQKKRLYSDVNIMRAHRSERLIKSSLHTMSPLILPTKSLAICYNHHHETLDFPVFPLFICDFSRCAMITMFGDVMVREHLVGRSSEVLS